jgi:hypothetical protein
MCRRWVVASAAIRRKGAAMLGFFVSLGSIVIKALAGSFGSTVGSKLGEALFSSFRAAGDPELPQRLATNPTVTDEQRAQPVVISSLANNAALRQEVETALEQARPGTVAKAKQVAEVLNHDPGLTRKIANGEVHFSEFEKAMARWGNWTDEQARYYATDTCPIGGEPANVFSVTFHDANGKEASMFSSALLNQALPIIARCSLGHEWRVDRA